MNVFHRYVHIYVILWRTSVRLPFTNTCNTLVVESSQLLSSISVAGNEGLNSQKLIEQEEN